MNPSPTPPTFAARLALLEDRTSPTGFLLLCTLTAFLLLQIVASPNGVVELLFTGAIHQNNPGRLADSYVPIAASPFSAQTPHAPQIRLRILGPLIAWLIGLSGPASGLISWIASFPAFYLIACLARKLFGPNPAASQLTLLTTCFFATLHPFVIGNAWLGYQDSLAALFILLALRLRPWWTLTPVLFLAMLADERSIAAAGLVLCWHFLQDPSDQRRTLARLRIVATIGAFGLWLCYASAMLSHLGMTPVDFVSPALVAFRDLFPKLPLHIAMAFRMGWVLLLLPFVMPITTATASRRWPAGIALFICVAPVVASACPVADVTRVVGTAFPAVLIAIALLHRWHEAKLPYLLLAAVIYNTFTPVVTGIGSVPYVVQSAPISLLMYLFGLPVKY